MLNIERLIQTGIPDIAPVYAGVRGRTMSSRHQAYAWPAIQEAGVQTIIDLREMDKSDKLPHLCQYHGLEYFHYPVDNHARTIAQMAELFPKFCEQIDKGDFYIACAMGLHRTDIALCTYWVFYAADKGVAPPPICGYRKDKGLTTNKIMRVLNAMYKYIAEMSGAEPIPEIVFHERKEIIKDLSRGK